MRELLAVRGLDTTSEAFRRKLVRISDEHGLNPSFVAAVISFETGGTFSASIKNPYSSATGLIQFLESTANKLGTTVQALSQMTAERQLDYVGEYYKQIIAWKGPIKSLEDHYLAVIAPKYVGASPDTVVYSKPSKAYRDNKGLDSTDDGTITAAEATTPVRTIVRNAEEKDRIIVTEVPDSPDDDLPLIGGVALFAIVIWSLSRYRHKTKLL